MRADRQLAMSALAFLFLAEGQRAWFASLFGLAYDAVFPELRPTAVLLAMVPLLALLAPMLPLARRLDRAGAVMIAVVGLAVFRLPLSFPDFGLRVVSSTLVMASGGLFLTWAVGHFEGRSVAAGAVAGLVLDQLLRLAGTSWDLSLRPSWLPVQAVLSLVLVFLVIAPAGAREGASPGGGDRDRGGDERGNGLERRSGGLRLRGALALGGLLFLDLHLLGLPPVLARWTGASYELSALAVSAASGVALVVALVGRGPVRNRMLALGLVLLLGLGLAAGPWIGGAPGALLLAAGHGAALLLLARALNPSSGRRGRAVVTAGMATFAALTALYAATFFHAFLFPGLEGAAPYILAATVVLIAASFLLLPQPPASPRRLPVLAGAGLGGAVVAAAALLLVALPGAPAAEATPAPDVRVATYNIHFGYDEGWRFDPAAIAGVLRTADADLVALQEVPVGMPTAYGVDLPLWLERRLGIPAMFSANVNGLQGEAVLSRLAVRRMRSVTLPPDESDRRQLLHLTVPMNGRDVDVYALHLSVHEDERAAQITAALANIAAGPAVLLGDLNAEPGSRVTRALAAAGFRDAFEATETSAGAPTGTWPARSPAMRIDWVWIRGVEVRSAEVLDAAPSDHRLVAATLQIGPTQ